VFLDDSGANVAGAQVARSAAYQLRGIVELTACVRTLGLIGDARTAPLIGDFHRINPV